MGKNAASPVGVNEYMSRHKRQLFIVVIAIFIASTLGMMALQLRGREVATISLVILICATIVLAVGFWMLFIKKVRPESFYLLASLVLGLMFMFLFTPGSVPDEFYHFESAYKYSDIILGSQIDDASKSIEMRQADIAYLDSMTPEMSLNDYRNVATNFELFSSDSSPAMQYVDSLLSITQNPPQVRVLSALGITFARLMNLGAIPLFYLGRLFNLLGFVALTYLGLRKLPFGKKAFIAIALLPMTVCLSASYSYDATINALSLLLVSLLLDAAYGEKLIEGKQIAIIAAVAFLLAPCKLIYCLLAGLVVLLPRSHFSSQKYSIAAKVAVIAATIFGVAILQLGRIGAIVASDASSASSSGMGVETYTFMGAIGNPLHLLAVFWNTISEFGAFYYQSMIGVYLGWFQIELSPLFTVAFTVLLIFAFAKYEGEVQALGFVQKLLCIIIVAVVSMLVMLSLMTSWTPNGNGMIIGVQGRYFIPLLPLLFLVLRNNGMVIADYATPYLLLAFMALDFVFVGQAFYAVCALA